MPDSEHSRSDGIRIGLREGATFSLVSWMVAVSFGVVATPELGLAGAIAMSALVFAASAQFAAVAVLTGGGGVLAAVAAGALASARYGPMGIALAPSLKGGRLRRAAIAQAMMDFSWAVAIRDGRVDPRIMLGASMAAYPPWIVGTALGGLAGGLIEDAEWLGLDVLVPAVFVALLVRIIGPDRRALAAALLGGVIALVLVPVAPAGVPVIAAAAAAAVGLARR